VTDEWVNKVYYTHDGTYAGTLPCSDGTWQTRLSGQGSGDHTVQAFGSGLSQAEVEELTLGNRYTITQEWAATDHVAYAGVIQRDVWDDKTRTVRLSSTELRGAYLNDRMMFGVDSYGGTSSVLTLASKSHAGAVRAVFDPVFAIAYLPIDRPADGSGGFSADWKFDERLKIEDHLKQIEDDGCEVFLRPYKTGGDLRWETLVGVPEVEIGSETTFAIRGDSSPVLDLKVTRDVVRQMTGVLAFGEGGKSAISAYTEGGGIGGPAEISVRDTWVNFPDITDAGRLQAASDHTFAALQFPTATWSFGLNIYPDGPEYAAPGSLLGATVASGHERLSAGTNHLRVVALSGSMGTTVKPEVQNAS
jgi:hypothetical protein